MPAPKTSTEVMPVTEPSVGKPITRVPSASICAATWSATPTTVSGTSHSHGLR